MPWLREKKFWPTVSRIDDGKWSRKLHVRRLAYLHPPAYGDLNLIVSGTINMRSSMLTFLFPV
jgi:hypothetical protein